MDLGQTDLNPVWDRLQIFGSQPMFIGDLKDPWRCGGGFGDGLPISKEQLSICYENSKSFKEVVTLLSVQKWSRKVESRKKSET